MRLKEFTTQQMVRTTGFWLQDGKDKIVAVPELTGFLTTLQRAHQGLLLPPQSAQPSQTEREIQVLQSKQKVLDLIHDRTVRGLIYLLLAYAQFAQTPEEETKYQRIVDELFPLGSGTVMLSYEEEAGAVEMRAGKLNEEIKGVLEKMPLLDGKSALDKLITNINAGRELGVIEQEKYRLKSSLPSSQGSPELQAARLYWVRTVKAFLAQLEVADLPLEEKRFLQAPVIKAEEVAARRRRGEAVVDDDVVVEDGDRG